jgi:membrane-associated phospholipid phosphatase
LQRSIVAGLALCLGTGACAAARGSDSAWGEGFTIAPGWERTGNALGTALASPATWIPAAGSLLLVASGLDAEIADWANDHTPIFRSRSNAGDASDWLRGASVAAYAGTALLAPGPDDKATRVATRAQGLAVGLAALGTTSGSTELLKAATDRRRPNGDDRESFPSGHASSAAAAARLARRNLESFALDRGQRLAWDITLATAAGATAWARVESGEHHPGDVLAGAALGNFIAILLHDAFLGRASHEPTAMWVEPSRGGAIVYLGRRF